MGRSNELEWIHQKLWARVHRPRTRKEKYFCCTSMYFLLDKGLLTYQYYTFRFSDFLKGCITIVILSRWINRKRTMLPRERWLNRQRRSSRGCSIQVFKFKFSSLHTWMMWSKMGKCLTHKTDIILLSQELGANQNLQTSFQVQTVLRKAFMDIQ